MKYRSPGRKLKVLSPPAETIRYHTNRGKREIDEITDKNEDKDDNKPGQKPAERKVSLMEKS